MEIEDSESYIQKLLDTAFDYEVGNLMREDKNMNIHQDVNEMLYNNSIRGDPELK